MDEDATKIAAADSIFKTSEAAAEFPKALSAAQIQLAQATDGSMNSILALAASSLKMELEALAAMS